MAQDLYQYEKMIERALRGVVLESLERAAREGLRGAHHFFIGFATGMPGVDIPDQLRARYPQDMTIVLQHQYWDLDVREESFSVTLSFQKQLERLTVPFAAVRSFADPSVNFALEFEMPEQPPARAARGAAAGGRNPGARQSRRRGRDPRQLPQALGVSACPLPHCGRGWPPRSGGRVRVPPLHDPHPPSPAAWAPPSPAVRERGLRRRTGFA
jgi:hypothetical protein